MNESKQGSAYADAARGLKARILRVALLHVQALDAKAAIALEASDLLNRTKPLGTFPDRVMEILADSKHPSRKVTYGGPSVFYKGDNDKRLALDMSDLFLSDDKKIRQAALLHFVEQGNIADSTIALSTFHALQALKQDLEAEQREKWQPACLRAHDLIRGDIKCALAGIRQAFAEQYEDALHTYMPKILDPSIASLEALNLAQGRPSDEKLEIIKAIQNIARSDLSVEQKYQRYVDDFGYVPLAGQMSFAALVEECDANGDAQMLWAWAKGAGPIGQMHACLATLSSPHWMANESIALDVLQHLEKVFKTKGDAETYQEAGGFEFMHDLAKHYLQCFELSAPGAHAEVLSVWAWWLADRVRRIFDEFPHAIEQFRNIGLIPAQRLTSMSHRLATPRMSENSLSLSTKWLSSPWTLSILASLSARNLGYFKTALQEDRRRALEASMTTPILFGLPFDEVASGMEIYTFETGIKNAVSAWRESLGGNERLEAWEQLGNLYAELNDPTKFLPKLSGIGDLDDAMQIIVANGAHALALRRKLPMEGVWNILVDKSWQAKTFPKLSSHALENLADGLLTAIVDGDENWQYGLPHVCATVCEEVDMDAERKETVFAVLVCACLTTYSVSAMQRVLSGRRKQDYLEAAQKWKSFFAELTQNGGGWVSARARALQATMTTTSM